MSRVACESGHSHAMTRGGNCDSHWQTRVRGHPKNDGQENSLELMDLAVDRDGLSLSPALSFVNCGP